MEKKILLPELPSKEENIIVKPTKAERKQKYENKKANVNKSKKDIKERKPIKTDHKILKSAINGMVNDITLYNENFTSYLSYTDYKAKFNNNVLVEMKSELDYFDIPYVNTELLSNTIEFSLIDIFKNDNKKHNIYANIVYNIL